MIQLVVLLPELRGYSNLKSMHKVTSDDHYEKDPMFAPLLHYASSLHVVKKVITLKLQCLAITSKRGQNPSRQEAEKVVERSERKTRNKFENEDELAINQTGEVYP